jgi:hypothetical protein
MIAVDFRRSGLQDSSAFRILSNETSNSRTTTTIEAPTVLSWGFFLSVGDISRVFGRVLETNPKKYPFPSILGLGIL